VEKNYLPLLIDFDGVLKIGDSTSKEAILIGKPSPIYFKTALQMLGFKDSTEFIMVGDDIETDIAGSQKIGGKGILVYTGKTKFPLPDDSEILPDYEAKDLGEVIEILKSKKNI
jgi:ribonucleotide monophosphatase NagD (HAD superfamily)